MCTFTFYVPTSLYPDFSPLFFHVLRSVGNALRRRKRERASSRMGNVLDGREQISLMDIDQKLSRPLLRVATITRVLTLPGLVPAEGLKSEMRGEGVH